MHMQENVLNLVAGNGNRFEELQPRDLNVTEQESIIELAVGILRERHLPGKVIRCTEDTARHLQLELAEEPNEVFGALFLNNRHHILAQEILFKGTLDESKVYPRVVVQRALHHNAAALIFYHNHPSGVAEPSQADQQITRRLKDALALIGVRILDHFVVGHQGTVSFAERGLL